VEVVHLSELVVSPQLSTLTSGELQHDRFRLSISSRLLGGSHLSGTQELQRDSTHLYTRTFTELMLTVELLSGHREFVD
jgi:hypothetical protein